MNMYSKVGKTKQPSSSFRASLLDHLMILENEVVFQNEFLEPLVDFLYPFLFLNIMDNGEVTVKGKSSSQLKFFMVELQRWEFVFYFPTPPLWDQFRVKTKRQLFSSDITLLKLFYR